MPRKNNVETRTQIIKLAQQLFYTKGYENTSVNDIINAVAISKGGFYHHFDSKQAVLMSVVDRLVEQSQALIRPIMENSDITALEKLRQSSNTVNSWKIEQRDQMVAIVKVLYSDGNLHLRHRLREQSTHTTVPIWAQILAEGIAEGVFDLGGIDEAHTAEFILSLLNNAGDSFIQLVIDPERPAEAADLAIKKFSAVEMTIERILGVPAGTLQLIDPADITPWLE